MLVFERQAEIERQLSITHTHPLSRAELEEVLEDDEELLRLYKKSEKHTYDRFGWNTAQLFSVHCPTLETFWDRCLSWYEVRISGEQYNDEIPKPRWDPMIPYRYDHF
jgi:hypothetical protein